MSDLKCGYCRDLGHRRPKCPILHTLRNKIYVDTVKERKIVYAAMIKYGLGNGAIVKVKEWDGPRTCIVTDLESCIDSWRFYSFRKERYSKKAVCDFTQLEGSYSSYNVKALVNGSMQHMRIPAAFLYEAGRTYYNNDRLVVAVPSHDEYEMDDNIWFRNIHISDRLAIGSELEARDWNTCTLNHNLTLQQYVIRD